jgi:hypothetical protein
MGCCVGVWNVTSAEETQADLLRLRNYIQEWLDANHETWTGLFIRAGHPNGTSTSWNRLRLKTHPRPETIRDVAQAMGIPWEQLLAVAGIIPGNGAGSTRTQSDYDLTPREAGLIDAFRALSEDHKSIVFAQVTGMAEATVQAAARTDT